REGGAREGCGSARCRRACRARRGHAGARRGARRQRPSRHQGGGRSAQPRERTLCVAPHGPGHLRRARGPARGRSVEMTQLTVLPHEALCPAGATIEAAPGTSVCDALLANGIEIEHACEKSCACTTCHVIVREG